MAHGFKTGLCVAAALMLTGRAFSAEPQHGGERGGERGGEARSEVRKGEPPPGPTHYQRVTAPRGWNQRPNTVDRAAYQHNFQAAQYILADYWLFALEVLPAGYEWVRVGADTLLVNVQTGEILQVEYGAFG